MSSHDKKRTESTEASSPSPKGRLWIKLAVAAVLVTVAVVGYVQFHESLSLKNLAARESDLRAFQHDHPILVYAIAFLVYVAVTGFSLPGAAALTLLYGWYFGFVPGLILVSFASTTGATVAFLFSRFLFRSSIQDRFGDRLAAFNAALEREGAFYLFTLRLIPAVPFFVINAVMGLTPLRTRTFWWVSQLGMIPGTCVYVYAGSVVPNLKKLADEGVKAVLTPQQITQILIAFVLLGLFPLIVKKIVQRFRPGNVEGNTGSTLEADDEA